MIPVLSSTIVDSDIYSKLVNLSSDWFGKDTLFNGRDGLWQRAFEQIQMNPILGEGGLRAIYTHNMSLDILTATGIAGWLFFVISCKIIEESIRDTEFRIMKEIFSK